MTLSPDFVVRILFSFFFPEKTEFIDKTKVITAALGLTITLNCTTVEGQAASWTHKSDRTCYTSTNNGSIINIEHLSPVDLGEHVCTVNNALYSVDKTINVKSLGANLG